EPEFDLPATELTVDGASLRLSRFPESNLDSSRAVVCVPGYGATGESFARLRPLARAYDLHFLTPPEEAQRARDPIGRFGQMVTAYARRFDRPVLLGTSFGGAVAIEAAASLGDRLSGLVLISTFPSLP